MKMRPRTLIAVVVLLMLAAPAFSTPHAASSWPHGDPTPQALQPLPGRVHSYAVDINARGQAVGRSIDADGVMTATIWDRKGNPSILMELRSNSWSRAEAINGSGQAAGVNFSDRPDGYCLDVGWSEAVRWDRHGMPTHLKPLPGDGETRAYGINNRGIATGISIGPRTDPANGDCSGSFTAVRWDRHGNPTELPSPSAFQDEGFGYDINIKNEVAGFINVFEGIPFSGAKWDRHGVGSVLEEPVGTGSYTTSGINNRGVIVGQNYTPYFELSAAIWDKDGVLGFLDPLDGDPEAFAFDINDRGYTVGASGVILFLELFEIDHPPSTAVRWDRDGVPTALAPLDGDIFSYGFGINILNHAVGHSVAGDGTATAVVWR